MSRSSKRIWNLNLSLEDGVKIALNFLIRSREKNILIETDPTLYKVFKKEGLVPVNEFKDISSFFRFSKNDTPHTDRSKNALIKLLSVSLKAHYHWFPKGIIKNEPYVFQIPDLLNSDVLNYGLIYYIESEGKCYSLMVAEWDLSSTVQKDKYYSSEMLPVILSKSSYKWLDYLKWKKIRNEVVEDYSLLNIHSLKHKKELFSKISLIKDREKFPYGRLLTYPIELKDKVHESGGEWANGLKSWFIPFGLDYDRIIEYMNFVQKKEKNNKVKE